ncbi:MAG TPA: hypothetical protein VF062_11770 [Candidatus Limnocylindrales bacterium]
MNDQPPAPLLKAPNAERYMLESENLRRRQLRSALLHGSGRNWRERRRIWPGALAGAIVVAVIVAVIGVYGAFQRQQKILEDEQRRRQSASAPGRSAASSPPLWSSRMSTTIAQHDHGPSR